MKNMFNKNKKTKISLMDIENEEPKTKLNINRNKDEKNLETKTVTALKALKIMIWAFIAFVLLLGVFQIVRSKQPKIIKNIVQYNFAPSESDTAKAFALTFAKQYLSYENNKPDDYSKRVDPFLIDAIKGSTRLEYAKGTSTVLNAIVWQVEKLSNEHSNIIVRAEVELKSAAESQQQQQKTILKTIYLKVPIGYFEDRYIVEDFPSFGSDPSNATGVKLDTYKGDKQEADSTKDEIKDVLTNFFKTYTTGTGGQIAYYMDNNNSIKGYEGKYVFSGIENLDAYKDGKDGSIAIVQVEMKDADLGTSFSQRFIFNMIKKTGNKTGRWYIKDFSARGNLYKDEGGTKNESTKK